MSGPNERICVSLEAIAAQAKLLAMDVRNGRLWEGELKSKLANIAAHILDAQREASKPN